MNEWISVDERLPEPYEAVVVAIYTTDLIFSKQGETLKQAVERCQEEAAKHPRVELGFVNDDGFWDSYDGWPMVCTPKFWMQLPEPPKDGIQSVSSLITFYDKEETYDNCTVQVLTNTKTGETSIGWRRNDE